MHNIHARWHGVYIIMMRVRHPGPFTIIYYPICSLVRYMPCVIHMIIPASRNNHRSVCACYELINTKKGSMQILTWMHMFLIVPWKMKSQQSIQSKAVLDGPKITSWWFLTLTSRSLSRSGETDYTKKHIATSNESNIICNWKWLYCFSKNSPFW